LQLNHFPAFLKLRVFAARLDARLFCFAEGARSSPAGEDVALVTSAAREPAATPPVIASAETSEITMIRTLLVAVIFAGFVSATPALADQKSDCLKGEAMLKREMKKKHSQSVQDQLKQALDNVGTEIMESDWPECVGYVAKARQVLKK
jgi:hypothetical protein